MEPERRDWLPMSDSRGRGRIDAKVLPEEARLHNRSLILQTLFREGKHSRADLARVTGLTKVSVSHVVEDLLSEEMLCEVGTPELARRGKPPMMLEFNIEAFQIICVDLSHSTLFRGAVMGPNGTVLHRTDVAIEGRRGQEALALVVELLQTLFGQLSAPVLGIGVGSPGAVTFSGTVIRAQSLGWEGIDIKAVLGACFSCHVSVANDANLAVQAERSHASGSDDMILVRIGHEVGAGLLLGGAQLFGSRSAAGEIGHVACGVGTPLLCTCGKKGCLETVLASARLDTALKSSSTAEARHQVLVDAGKALGNVLAPLVVALELSEIVLSGPHLILDGPLSEAVRLTVRSRALPIAAPDVPVRMTVLGDDIVLRGAATQVMREQLGIS